MNDVEQAFVAGIYMGVIMALTLEWLVIPVLVRTVTSLARRRRRG